MNFLLSIRPNRPGILPAGRGAVEYVLARVAHIRREGPGEFVYGDAAPGSFMRIQVGVKDPVESIRVSIPFKLMRSDGGGAFRVCFKIADQLGWGILDEQLRGYLERDAIPDLLKRYENEGETMTEFLYRRPAGRRPFPEIFRFHLRTHKRVETIVCLVLAAIVAGFIILRFDAPLISFPGVAAVLVAVFFSAKALFQSLRRMRRRGDSTPGNPL